MLLEYLPFLKSEGRVVIITPQEKGFRSDSTYPQFMDFVTQKRILGHLRLDIEKQYSFPFPLFQGKIFTNNEFVVISRKI